MRMTIVEQRLNKFTNNDKFQREGISELINTLNKTVKQIKKSKVDKVNGKDVINKLTKNMQKLILNATQIITKKISATIRQMPTYVTDNFSLFSKQAGG
jgi:hypothetical protein